MTARTPGQYPICLPLTEIPDSLHTAGRNAFADFSIRIVASTPSTQDFVRSAVLAGASQGFCCVALEQTKGRGRQDRTWYGEPGQSLLVSIAVAPPAGAPHALPFVSGLAVHDAVAIFGVAADVKWPNDILVRRRKLAGILVEGIGATGLASIGIGLNIDIDNFPPGVEGTSLAPEAGRRICWQEVLEALLPSLRARLDQAARESFESIAKSWTRRSSSIGTTVTAVTAGATLVGTAIGLDGTGALLLGTDKGVARLLAADVHISPEP
jgi:BirA family biotin operon repressor/biotin-[acetyl-CoA-carboxylase] ligase